MSCVTEEFMAETTERTMFKLIGKVQLPWN